MTNSRVAKLCSFLAAAFLTLGLPAVAHAVPVLQVYVEGAVYDSVNETWTLDTTTTSGNVTITATTQNGGGPVNDVLNVFMVVSALEDTSFGATLTGGDANLNLSATSSLGDSPLLTGGDANNAASYLSFSLGNFTGTADATIDYVGGTGNGSGNSQTYSLTLTNLTGTVIIDAYGSAKGKLVVAPYSHNGAITTVSDVPELSAHGSAPAATLLLGGLLLLQARRRRQLA